MSCRGCLAYKSEPWGYGLPTEQRREDAKASGYCQSPCLLLHHAHASPNTALEATGHSAGCFSAWVSVPVARASAGALCRTEKSNDMV